MTISDEVSGLLEVIDAGEPQTAEPVETQPIAEGAESGTPTTTPEAEAQVESAPETTPTTGQDPEPETSEPSQTKTETNTQVDTESWKEALPKPPPAYQGKQPEFDPDTGLITNMDAAEYAQYMRETTKAELKLDMYNQYVEDKAFEVAEQILPELKTNANVRRMVENARLASLYSGNPIDTVQAAIEVQEALGIAPSKIKEARSEGERNARVSIEIQENSALETGSTQLPAETNQADALVSRIQKGDDDAVVELLGLWENEGKLQL